MAEPEIDENRRNAAAFWMGKRALSINAANSATIPARTQCTRRKDSLESVGEKSNLDRDTALVSIHTSSDSSSFRTDP